jgi:hypothetical protein
MGDCGIVATEVAPFVPARVKLVVASVMRPMAVYRPFPNAF